MSCSKWRYTEACDHRICPGDCDLCGYSDEEDEEVEDEHHNKGNGYADKLWNVSAC